MKKYKIGELVTVDIYARHSGRITGYSKSIGGDVLYKIKCYSPDFNTVVSERAINVNGSPRVVKGHIFYSLLDARLEDKEDAPLFYTSKQMQEDKYICFICRESKHKHLEKG